MKGKPMLKTRGKKPYVSSKMFTALQSKSLFVLLTNAKLVALAIGGRCLLSAHC